MPGVAVVPFGIRFPKSSNPTFLLRGQECYAPKYDLKSRLVDQFRKLLERDPRVCNLEESIVRFDSLFADVAVKFEWTRTDTDGVAP